MIYLLRTERNRWGIFGLLKEGEDQLAVTLEHAYPKPDGSFAPKLPEGKYLCARGYHQLKGMDAPFETFEIKNVPGHSGMLFHWGNYNRDSSGCVLLGKNNLKTSIDQSILTFQAFMKHLKNVEQFEISVQNLY